MALYNPKAEFITILEDINSTTIRELFELSYDKYKLPNNIIVIGSQKNFTSFSICVYNPFYGDQNSRHPFVYCEIINKGNLKEIARKMKRFMEMRFLNMNKYPVKVSHPHLNSKLQILT